MHKEIVFNASVKQVTRNKEDKRLRLDIMVDGDLRVEEYEKVAFCHGCVLSFSILLTINSFLFIDRHIPFTDIRRKQMGQNLKVLRNLRVLWCIRKSSECEWVRTRWSQLQTDHFSSDEFNGKRIVVVGVSSTASDVIASLLPVASKVYMSLRRGATLVPKFRKGFPPDLMTTWRRRQMAIFLQRAFPNSSRRLIDWLVQFATKQTYGDLDPAWGLLPAPSLTLHQEQYLIILFTR
jgi:dimethylaniline monooxygenase (N-oxide forming)